MKLLRSSILDGRGPRALEAETGRRRAEAFETRANIDRNTSALRGPDRTALPVLIVGDFNTPPVSQLYREVWPDFTNAFNAAGFGFGYTAPSIRRRRWFDDVPWLRIDHILTDDHWSVLCCRIGHGRGSDHRLIWADVALSK